MSFLCQQNQTLQEINTTVVEVQGNKVRVADTLLFPEGGGQLCDYGWIDEIAVKECRREGALAWYYVSDDKHTLKEGQNVHVKVDWTRRLELMKTHSGQHLFSGLMDKLYGIPTTSWTQNTGIMSSTDLGVDSTKLTVEMLKVAEDYCNYYCSYPFPLKITTFNSTEELDQFSDNHGLPRTRGLPADVVWPLRATQLIMPLPVDSEGNHRSIDDLEEERKSGDYHSVEMSFCCGTHVSNMTELKHFVIHPNFERTKVGEVRVHFSCGDVVKKIAKDGIKLQQEFQKMLGKSSFEEQTSFVEKKVAQANQFMKATKGILRNLAQKEAESSCLERVLRMDRSQKHFKKFDIPECDKEFLTEYARYCGFYNPLSVGTGQHVLLTTNSEILCFVPTDRADKLITLLSDFNKDHPSFAGIFKEKSIFLTSKALEKAVVDKFTEVFLDFSDVEETRTTHNITLDDICESGSMEDIRKTLLAHPGVSLGDLRVLTRGIQSHAAVSDAIDRLFQNSKSAQKQVALLKLPKSPAGKPFVLTSRE